MNNCSCTLVSDCAWVFSLFCFFYSSTICTRVPASVAAVATRALKMVKKKKTCAHPKSSAHRWDPCVTQYPTLIIHFLINSHLKRRLSVSLIARLILGCDHLRLAPFTLFPFTCCTVTGPIKNNASFSLTQTSFPSHAHAP